MLAHINNGIPREGGYATEHATNDGEILSCSNHHRPPCASLEARHESLAGGWCFWSVQAGSTAVSSSVEIMVGSGSGSSSSSNDGAVCESLPVALARPLAGGTASHERDVSTHGTHEATQAKLRRTFVSMMMMMRFIAILVDNRLPALEHRIDCDDCGYGCSLYCVICTSSPRSA